MGLCIYYSGKIKDAASLPRLVEEVKDIAAINKWKYRVLESSFPNFGLKHNLQECLFMQQSLISSNI